MILFIDTTDNKKIQVALYQKEGKFFKRLSVLKVNAWRKQSEKLLPIISKILTDNKFSFQDLKMIAVNNCGGSFTSLRIGVITANALAYALKIKAVAAYLENENLILDNKSLKKFSNFNVVEALYDREPNIGKSKKIV